MSAAILQGVPLTTFDTDIWIDLPERQYVKVLTLCQRLGATILRNTVVTLEDDTLVNFIYRVTGLNSFSWEYRRAKRIQWLGSEVAVLPLERIYHSKRVVNRPKDVAHCAIIQQVMDLQARASR